MQNVMLTRRKSKQLGETNFEHLKIFRGKPKKSKEFEMAMAAKETVGKPTQSLPSGLHDLERELEFSQMGGQPRGADPESRHALEQTERPEQVQRQDRPHGLHFAYHPAHNPVHYSGGTSKDGLPPPSPFEGKSAEDAETWLHNFILWSEIKQHPDSTRLQIFPYLLKAAARTWYDTQSSSTKQDWEGLCEAFLSRYVQQGILHHNRVGRIFNLSHEGPVLDFLEKMQVEGHKCGFNEDLLISAAIKALKPEIRSFVLQQDVKDWQTLCKMAFIAETSVKPNDSVLQQIATDLKSLHKQLEEGKSINSIQTTQPSQQQPQ